MSPLPSMEERRFSRRFRVTDKAAFVSSANWPGKGTLVDISDGGFAFHYQSSTPWPSELNEFCQVIGMHDSFIDNLPVWTVADQVVSLGGGNTLVVRRRSLKFGPLTSNQQFLLECFIWINSMSHC